MGYVNSTISEFINEWISYLWDDEEHFKSVTRTVLEGNDRTMHDIIYDELTNVYCDEFVDGGMLESIFGEAMRAEDWLEHRRSLIDAFREYIDTIDDAIMYLVDGGYGIYMFAELVQQWDHALMHDNAEDLDIVRDEDAIDQCEYYHDIVTDILDAGMYHDGHEYLLMSGDGIWAVREDIAPFLPDDFPS